MNMQFPSKEQINNYTSDTLERMVGVENSKFYTAEAVLLFNSEIRTYGQCKDFVLANPHKTSGKHQLAYFMLGYYAVATELKGKLPGFMGYASKSRATGYYKRQFRHSYPLLSGYITILYKKQTGSMVGIEGLNKIVKKQE